MVLSWQIFVSPGANCLRQPKWPKSSYPGSWNVSVADCLLLSSVPEPMHWVKWKQRQWSRFIIVISWNLCLTRISLLSCRWRCGSRTVGWNGSERREPRWPRTKSLDNWNPSRPRHHLTLATKNWKILPDSHEPRFYVGLCYYGCRIHSVIGWYWITVCIFC